MCVREGESVCVYVCVLVVGRNRGERVSEGWRTEQNENTSCEKEVI